MKICKHCGAELSDNAVSCKECGSDAETGWADGAESSDLELPDYDEILENEFGPKKRSVAKIVSAVVGVILAIVLVIVFSGVL